MDRSSRPRPRPSPSRAGGPAPADHGRRQSYGRHRGPAPGEERVAWAHSGSRRTGPRNSPRPPSACSAGRGAGLRPRTERAGDRRAGAGDDPPPVLPGRRRRAPASTRCCTEPGSRSPRCTRSSRRSPWDSSRPSPAPAVSGLPPWCGPCPRRSSWRPWHPARRRHPGRRRRHAPRRVPAGVRGGGRPQARGRRPRTPAVPHPRLLSAVRPRHARGAAVGAHSRCARPDHPRLPSPARR